MLAPVFHRSSLFPVDLTHQDPARLGHGCFLMCIIPQEVLPRHILGILNIPDEWFDKPTISRTWPYLIFKKKRLWILDGPPCVSIMTFIMASILEEPAPSSPDFFFRPNRRFSDDAVWRRGLRDGEVEFCGRGEHIWTYAKRRSWNPN